MISRIVRQIHLWAGIALCLPLVMLGLTGSVLVFEDQLAVAFAPPVTLAAGEAKPVGDIIAAAKAAAPAGYLPQSYAAPGAGDGRAVVRFAPERRGNAGGAPGAGGDMKRVVVDPVSLATYPDPPEGFLRQVVNLHTTLLMKNREGRQLVGWLGVVMLVMGVSGLVNWWPRAYQWKGSQWKRAFGIRKGARGYALNREAHGMAGIWGLVVFIVVSFGGVTLAFPESVRAIVDLVMPARDLRAVASGVKVEPQRGGDPMPVDDAIALARAQVPGGELRFVFLPTRPDQPIRVALLRPGQERREPNVAVFVDPWTRRIVETLDPRQYSLGETVLAWQHPLHAGQGLGWVWKILVFLSGFLPLLFAITGISMWWLRKRRAAARPAAPETTIDPAYSARRAGE